MATNPSVPEDTSMEEAPPGQDANFASADQDYEQEDEVEDERQRVKLVSTTRYPPRWSSIRRERLPN